MGKAMGNEVSEHPARERTREETKGRFIKRVVLSNIPRILLLRGWLLRELIFRAQQVLTSA